MSTAENFPAFNAAVAELTLKVQSLVSDVAGAQANLGPEVAAALSQLESVNASTAAAVQAATTASQAAAAVQALETAFNNAIGTVAQLTTDVGGLTTEVTTAKNQIIASQSAMEAALETIENISGNLAKIVQATPAGVAVVAGGSSTISAGKTATRGAVLMLGVMCTTTAPMQMYDVKVKVGATTVYDSRGILGNLSDSFSSFSVASGEVTVILTNHGSAAATLTPVVMFSELALV